MSNPASSFNAEHLAVTDQMRFATRQRGIEAGLEVLNRRVSYRFTAVYRLEGQIMRNIAVFDKRGEPLPAGLREVPLVESFCQFVLRNGSFSTSNSGIDKRLDGNPYQGVLGSYVALPLTAMGRGIVGTFCHMDYVAQDPVCPDEYALMQLVAHVLPPYMERAAVM